MSNATRIKLTHSTDRGESQVFTGRLGDLAEVLRPWKLGSVAQVQLIDRLAHAGIGYCDVSGDGYLHLVQL